MPKASAICMVVRCPLAAICRYTLHAILCISGKAYNSLLGILLGTFFIGSRLCASRVFCISPSIKSMNGPESAALLLAVIDWGYIIF